MVGFQSIYALGRTQRGIKGFIPSKLPKLDFKTDANLVNANIWLQNVQRCILSPVAYPAFNFDGINFTKFLAGHRYQ